MIIPVILSGGAGTRLWPVSRKFHPKPFIKLSDGQSFLQKTYQRASQLTDVQEIITITNNEYYLLCKSEFSQDGHAQLKHSFLLEPFGKNTAPAVALAALKVFAVYGPEAVLLVLPADHLINDQLAFNEACQTAVTCAKTNKIVTFGIIPRSPEIGYGYIECGEPYHIANTHQIAQFIEKPTLPVAQEYMNSNKHLWNSGMFCFNAKTMLSELELHAPQILEDARTCWQQANGNYHSTVTTFRPVDFEKLTNISLDYALMEKTDASAVVSAHFDWCDIGSWEAYYQLHKADENGNTVLGNAILLDCQNTFIHNKDKLVASIGVDNLLVIDTNDALLITHRDRSQDVKKVVEKLAESKHHSYYSHRTVQRPWGYFTVLEEGPYCKIKKIVVNPGSALSLQSHQHRNEHWIVVEGTAEVINGDEEVTLRSNESIYIPMKTIHRLTNATSTRLVVIEVQTGNYLGEDDIVRYEDIYDRVCEAVTN